ncbi:RAD55 family ATPase [Thermogladius sp. 4427co]|uniref:RAD55 family ATPase n=1 Tax=Thermogladius sp. 4427co TaxID=3450718 RepID=UPI003F78EDE2
MIQAGEVPAVAASILRRLLDIVRNSRTTLFYGPAASGKTNILLTLARELCRVNRCVYISTEGTLHYEKIARASEAYYNVEFVDVLDFDQFIELVVKTTMMPVFKYLFIDSINALYRPIALDPNATSKYLFVLGRLYSYTSRDRRVLASAQVRTGENGELEASGFKLIEFYFDTIFQVGLEDSKRFLLMEKPYNRKFKAYFRISDRGAEFV